MRYLLSASPKTSSPIKFTFRVMSCSFLFLICGFNTSTFASKTIALVSSLKCLIKNGTLSLGANLPQFKKAKSRNFSNAVKKSAMPYFFKLCSMSSKLAFLSLHLKERSKSSISITLFFGLFRSFCIFKWNSFSEFERLASIFLCNFSANNKAFCIILYLR